MGNGIVNSKWNNMRAAYIAAIAILVPYIALLCIYLFVSRAWLLHTFFSGNYYHSAEFPVKYFNDNTKHAGNWLAAAGMFISISLLVYFVTRYRTNDTERLLPATPRKSPWLWSLVLPFAVLGLWGMLRMGISGDEIFSAVYCAGNSFFRTYTYYMLPNNHIFFNMLCHALAQLLHADAVWVGRGISFIAYLVMLLVAWQWLRDKMGAAIPALLAVVVLALQLPVYLFALQSRGYELQLLCTWVSFISLLQYLLYDGTRRHLRAFTISSVIAFACIPTYLYFFTGQVCFSLCVQLFRRHADKLLMRYIGFVIAGTALFYIPSLCYSGIAAFTDNEYVHSAPQDMAKFLEAFNISVYIYVNAMFSSFIGKDHIANMILFGLPLLLFFSRNGKNRYMGLFYILLWISWAALCFKMQRMPFSRNMIPYASISLAMVIYTIFLLLRKVWLVMPVGKLRMWLTAVSFTLFIAVFASNQFKWCTLPRNFDDETNANNTIRSELSHLPSLFTIACSSWSYSYYYFAIHTGKQATLYPSGNEYYFINMKEEPLPAYIADNYILLRHTQDGYDIYQHK